MGPRLDWGPRKNLKMNIWGFLTYLGCGVVSLHMQQAVKRQRNARTNDLRSQKKGINSVQSAIE